MHAKFLRLGHWTLLSLAIASVLSYSESERIAGENTKVGLAWLYPRSQARPIYFSTDFATE